MKDISFDSLENFIMLKQAGDLQKQMKQNYDIS